VEHHRDVEIAEVGADLDGVQRHRVLGGDDEALALPAGLKGQLEVVEGALREVAEVGEHALGGLAGYPAALDQLGIAVGAAVLALGGDAEVHDLSYPQNILLQPAIRISC